MKIAFGMIVFNGDYVLQECLESVYPYATQILIAEGPVRYWQDQGYTTSTDKTNEILANFPDPENKITIVHGQFEGKDEECRAYMPHMRDDIDYIWNLDSDEIYKPEDIEKIIQILKKENYTSVELEAALSMEALMISLGALSLLRITFLESLKYTLTLLGRLTDLPLLSHPLEPQHSQRNT